MPTFSRAKVAATVLTVVAVLPAQNPPTSPAMFATEHYLFVLRGDELWQFDVDTLAPRHTFRFPGAEAGRGIAKARSERPAQPPAAVAPPEVVLPPGSRRAAVQAGLEWLARHQDDDGKWDCDGFMRHDPAGEPCDGAGNPVHDVGVTGLSMLAMLVGGSTLRSGPHREALKRAAKWLVDQQDDNGRFGSDAAHDFVYGHAIATLAMCEAYGLSNYQLLRRPAQQGLDYLESHRNPYSVWRYRPRDNDNDTSVTTWAVCALASGQYFGLAVNGEALKLAGVWYDQVSDPSGRHGYSKHGEPSSRLAGDHARRFPPENGEAMTAAAAAGRMLLGQDPAEVATLAAAAGILAKKPPRWEEGHADSYYWYWGTAAMANLGEPWRRGWNGALDVLLAHQRRDGASAGSFDPVGVWDEAGGRVLATALCTLSLATADAAARRAGK
jgi:hypothetical protein